MGCSTPHPSGPTVPAAKALVGLRTAGGNTEENQPLICFQSHYIYENRPLLAMYSREVLCQAADNGNHPGAHYFGGSLP